MANERVSGNPEGNASAVGGVQRTGDEAVISPLTGPVFDPEEENTVVSIPPPTMDTGWASAAPRVRDRATLTVLSGSNLGAMYAFETSAIIGRARECLVRIDDAVVSRRHARVVRQDLASYVIEDLKSRNGTFVNGTKIDSHRLCEGDRVSFGSALTLRFGMTDELEEVLLRRLYESSVLDGLTGAFNRKHFSERLAGEVAYAKRHDIPLSLLLFDIDHFKRVNDTHGHLVGDQVLRSLAGVIKRTLRTEDVFARYGGEEFVIIARGTDAEKGYLFADRIRGIVERMPFECVECTLHVTVSIGIASLACCKTQASVEELLSLADRRMYEAKSQGRNRCVGAQPDPTTRP